MSKSKSIKCGHCKHPAHTADNCQTRVVDAAGDSDTCPCGVSTSEKQPALLTHNAFDTIKERAERSPEFKEALAKELTKEELTLVFPTAVFKATVTVHIDQPSSRQQRWFDGEFTEGTLSRRIDEIQREGYAVVDPKGAVIYPAHTIYKIEVARG